jgi:CMP-N-acetylneuraminic acid synthetase
MWKEPMLKHKLVALLPMKAHSERIPRKNFKTFAGKPLFRWILDTLLSIDSVEKVIINTDAVDLLEKNGVSSDGRVQIRQRSDRLVGDLVSMNRILEDDIQAIDSQLYLMTHNTNPLLQARTIEAALEYYRIKDCDSLFTVNRYQTRFYRADASPVNHDPDNLIRTQDLEPWFEENSCMYLFSRDSFAKTGARIGVDPIIYEIPKIEAVDIDEPEDWEIAEALALRNPQLCDC